MCDDVFKILLINVYMPYEVFADQLVVMEDVIDNNTDCHVIVGGDFNVDLDRIHTAMLVSAVT